MTMMGHRESLKEGEEEEALTSWGRRWNSWKRGKLRKIKRAFSKRVRKDARLTMDEE